MERVEIVRVGKEARAYRADGQEFEALVRQVEERRKEEEAARRTEAVRTIEARWPGARLLEGTELRLVPQTAGSGRTPQQGDTVSVHFTFSLLDGTQVDDTRARGEPYRFEIGVARLIPGLELAIGSLPEGGRTLAIIPPELAFGAAGVPPVVEPNSFVVFDIELLSME